MVTKNKASKIEEKKELSTIIYGKNFLICLPITKTKYIFKTNRVDALHYILYD
jgi:hypothetical protein